MTLMEDFINVNKDSIERTIKSLSKNWIVLFVGIVYGVLNTVIYGVVNILFRGPLSIIAGFIGAFISAAMISNYLYLLHNTINHSKITIEEFKYGFSAFLYKVYGVMFVFYMIRLLLTFTGLSKFYGILVFLAVIFLNALPETIYQKHYDANTSISYSFEFAKENILNWYGSNIIVGLVLFLLSSRLLFMSRIVSFRGVVPIINVRTVLIQAIMSLIMIYRGHLFSILSTSTRRKREFMSKF